MVYSIPIPPEHEISESRVEFSTRGRVLVFRPGVESFDPGSSLSTRGRVLVSTRGRVFRPGVESESFTQGRVFRPGVESVSTPGRVFRPRVERLSTRGRAATIFVTNGVPYKYGTLVEYTALRAPLIRPRDVQSL